MFYKHHSSLLCDNVDKTPGFVTHNEGEKKAVFAVMLG